MSKTLKLIGIVAAVTLTLASCGTDSDPSSSGNQGSEHNSADVSFAQAMIPHHAQAIAMAKMAQSRASDPKVKALAADIAAAQQPEITTMSTWLKSWDEKVPPPGSSMTDLGSMGGGGMPGMMTSDQMTQLAAASGPTFDQMWLQMMIQHHTGAIEMAKTEQSDGQNTDAIGLAKKIEAAQTEEIASMRSILGS